MSSKQWCRDELLQKLKLTIAEWDASNGVAESDLVALCAEVARRQFTVRIECETADERECHQCRRTLVIDETPVAEWDDHFDSETKTPWVSQLSSSFPLPGAAARALGIDDGCVDPTECLEERR